LQREDVFLKIIVDSGGKLLYNKVVIKEAAPHLLPGLTAVRPELCFNNQETT